MLVLLCLCQTKDTPERWIVQLHSANSEATEKTKPKRKNYTSANNSVKTADTRHSTMDTVPVMLQEHWIVSTDEVICMIMPCTTDNRDTFSVTLARLYH
jgi:hypothetical protein